MIAFNAVFAINIPIVPATVERTPAPSQSL